MATGAFLPTVRFPAALQKELARHLRGHDAVAIIADLESVVQIVPVFRRVPRRQSARRALQDVQATARTLRRRLCQLADDDVGDHLAAEAMLCWDSAQFRPRLLEALDALDAAIDKTLELSQRRARGGRRRDLEATWLVERTTDTLMRHGVPVTDEDNGIRARVLQALWPHALGREAPIALRPWFKLLKVQR